MHMRSEEGSRLPSHPLPWVEGMTLASALRQMPGLRASFTRRILHPAAASYRVPIMTPVSTLVAVLLIAGASQTAGAGMLQAVPLDVHKFQVLGERYDPENPRPPEPTYYRTIDDPGQSFIRGRYVPPADAVTLFQQVPDSMRHGVRRMQWRWRA